MVQIGICHGNAGWQRVTYHRGNYLGEEAALQPGKKISSCDAAWDTGGSVFAMTVRLRDRVVVSRGECWGNLYEMGFSFPSLVSLINTHWNQHVYTYLHSSSSLRNVHTSTVYERLPFLGATKTTISHPLIKSAIHCQLLQASR
jgi:hypothetical protein